jgi:tight adherence protein C
MDRQTLFLICIAGAIAAAVYFLLYIIMGDSDAKLRKRLAADKPDATASEQAAAGKVVPALQRIGQAASQPFMPKTREKQSALRRTLARAGLYSPQAIRTVAGFKVILMVTGIALGYVGGMLAGSLLLGLSIGGLIGYAAPALWLRQKVKSNQRALSTALPDALDLMVVCVEAGLTIDAAMQRVGEELSLAHPALAREMGITHMETRVGLSRMDALRNLGQRTANAALQSLAAMLIQADRFGTSVADALRIQAESMRLARHYAAEEMAAKASVKMSFPLVLFIFPATFIVLAGPTVIQLLNSPIFN